MYERDRQTDAQTPHDGIGRVCIASRGKNASVGATVAALAYRLLLSGGGGSGGKTVQDGSLTVVFAAYWQY